MWILYSVGIVLLIMFAKSMILNPILFRKRWQDGIGYGVPAAVCLVIFFMSMYFDYSSEQAYFDDQRNRVTASNWQPPQVSGNVTPVKATTANSNYVSIPVPQNKNLQNGLITLQKNLDSLQNTINSKVVTTLNNVDQYIDSNGKGTIIGDTDSKIYHLPGDPYYEKEMRKTSNNVYFKTAAEAESAGYRAIKK